MSMFNSFDTSASALSAERLRMDIISQNLANATTTRTEDGTPYRRKIVTFTEKDNSYSTSFRNVLANSRRQYSGSGVKVDKISQDYVTEMKRTYDPSHPDADQDGYVTLPNVNTVTEMTNLIDASRGYEANVTAFNTSKAIALKGLEIGK